MPEASIAFQSSEGQYNFEGVAELVNCYAEKRGPDAKAPLSIVPCDGIIELSDDATGPIRGLLFMEDLEKLYTIHSSSAWKSTWNGSSLTTVRIGTVPGIDMAQLSRNQKADAQIAVRTDSGVQFIESDSLSYSADGDFPADVISADYVGGYHVYMLENRKYFISSIDSAKVIDALDFETFQQRAGKGVRVVENAGHLVGFNSSWLEFHTDTGNADFPFEPLAFRDTGLGAPNSVVRSDNTLMFQGDDKIIYRLDNYNPMRISTHSVERLINDDIASENMIGFAWTHDGHKFSNFTGTNYSRCYDAATGLWHSRVSYGYDTWRARFATNAWGMVIVGDKLTGKLGYLDRHTYTEFGDPIIWKVVSPPLHVYPDGAILDAVHFDMATGYGLLSGQGSDPKLMLRVSKDGGNTFQQYRELSLGVTGKYATRITARNLGEFGPRGIVFELSISDPVARGLVLCDVEVRKFKR